jgi:hypothetical protein
MTSQNDVIKQARETLQDVDAVHWSDKELYRLLGIAAAEQPHHYSGGHYPKHVADVLWYETVKMAREVKP